MLAVWMIWVVALSALLVITATVAEKAVAPFGWPRRWIWVVALSAVVVLPVTTRGSNRGQPADPPPSSDRAASMAEGERAVSDSESSNPAGARSLAVARLSGVDRALLFLWLASSAVYFAYLVHSARRLRRERSGWIASQLDGSAVWIMESGGPALVGILRPRVAVPRWLLSWSQAERSLILRHELEHASAGDPWVNAFGLAVLGIMPWNPFLWWGRGRLVQAIDVDCDARVLRATADPRSYARVLLEVARWTVPIRPALGTLTATNSRLERRIEMVMKHDTPRRVTVGLSVLAVAGLAALAATAAKAPDAPATAYLAGLLPAQVPPDLGGGMIPGRLPFTPTPEQTSMSLALHHPRVLGRGLSADQRVWFVIDREMQILHTGVGPAEGLHERVRSLHPESVTDYVLYLMYDTVDGLTIETVWFVPEPPEPPGG